MRQNQSCGQHAKKGVLLRVCNASTSAPRPIRWRINGYPASLLIWSLEEWERLPERPADAQLHPMGVWCALRLD
jgi:hypothetical protein